MTEWQLFVPLKEHYSWNNHQTFLIAAAEFPQWPGENLMDFIGHAVGASESKSEEESRKRIGVGGRAWRNHR